MNLLTTIITHILFYFEPFYSKKFKFDHFSPQVTMYKNPFSSPCIKTINAIFTKITRVRATVTYMIPTKFQLDRMERFGSNVFTHIHTHTRSKCSKLGVFKRTHQFLLTVCLCYFSHQLKFTEENVANCQFKIVCLQFERKKNPFFFLLQIT